MYSNLIETHIYKIENKIKEYSNQNNILVYKGFPPNFIKKISEYFSTPNVLLNAIKTDNKIDLSYIEKNKKNLLKEILSIEKSVLILPYEVFYALATLLNINILDSTIFLIDNNLFKKYPNPTTLEITDIEGALSQNKPINEDEIFNTYFANSLIRNHHQYVEYQDLPDEILNDTTELPYFNEKYVDEITHREINEKEINRENFIIFHSADGSYEDFKYQIFRNNWDQDAKILIDDTQITSDRISLELGALLELFQASDLQIDIFKLIKEKKKEYRQEFEHLLKKHWNSDSFRSIKFYKNPNSGLATTDLTQGTLIEDIVTQSERALKEKSYKDIFLTAPTGSGKSLLFQIPAMYLAEKYEVVSIVVSPLKALMKDQVSALRERGYFNAAFINSDISLIQREKIIKQIKEGRISTLYLSPELLLSYDISHFIGNRRLGMLVVDEAHLVTTWGRDFRVDYWYLGNYIQKLRKYHTSHFPVIALTATAVYDGPDDLVFETISSLNMQVPELYIGNIRRDDIRFKIQNVDYDKGYEESRIKRTVAEVKSYINQGRKSIVYFPWTNQIETTKNNLPAEIHDRVAKYYGSVTKEVRNEVIRGFKQDELDVVLATKAFGMGVDISDIEEVYHHAPSGNLSDYIQEVGRVARKSGLMGTARVDFNETDLKYTKILYGLSAIRQWMVKRVLQKLYDIYKNKNKRNFLVSIDDFKFIFGDVYEDQIAQKVKSTLLLLERDLLSKYQYNVIIVRPKTLFSTVFIRVNKKVQSEFLKKYDEYSIKEHNRSQKRVIYNEGKKITLNPNKNPVYRLKLDKLWENKYSDKSFPAIKKKFFDKELFGDLSDKIKPQYKLIISLKESGKITRNKLKLYFGLLEKAFLQLQNKTFSKDDLENILKTKFKDRNLRLKIVDLLISIYSSTKQEGRKRLAKGCFLQKRRDGIDYKYRIFDNAYVNAKNQLERKFIRLFTDSDQNYIGFIKTDTEKSRQYLRLAYVLECFDLGTYELEGGDSPQLFIRINDPLKIQGLKNSKYTNNIVEDIEKRHHNSVEIMEYFFNKEMKNNTRWSFIERYFLGEELDFLKDFVDQVEINKPS